jgi:hypothetical protein
MKTNYKSVPVIASVIGSHSRKSMYLVHITNLSGTKLYRNKWVPTSWNHTTETKYYYKGQQIFLGKYYDFGSKGKLLMTNKGPVTPQGVEIKVKDIKSIPTKEPRHIAWKYHNQEFVEFDMKDATAAMMFESYDLTNISRFNHKLVGTKVHKYYEMIDRYIIMIPTWLISTFEEIGSRKSTDDTTTNLFHNDDNPESIIEETSINSHITDKFSYRGDANDMYMSDFAIEDSESLQQWDSDNPDYS